MPDIQGADYAELIRDRTGTRGEVGTSISPEIVPVITIDDFTRPALNGAFSQGLGAGGVGNRSEILLQYFPVWDPPRTWALDVGPFWVTPDAAGAIFVEIVFGAVFAGFAAAGRPAFGDITRGLAPLNIGTRNGAAATAGVTSVTRDAVVTRAVVGEYVHIPLVVTLRAFDVAPFQGSCVVRPTADNVGLRVYGRFRLYPNVP